MRKTSLTLAVVCTLVVSVSRPAAAQLPTDPAERARVIAEITENNSRLLTVFDRQGSVVGTVGARDLYNQPVFSPDATRMAVVKPDLEKETNDLWVFDVATGRGTQITSSQSREGANSPAWSPDGRYVAYVALRSGYFGLYRKPSDGTGSEELLYRNSAPMTLTDWSQDGAYLTYFSADLSGGALFALPLEPTGGERTPIEVFRSSFQATGPRLSPDNRFMAFASNQSGRTEIYVVPFDPRSTAETAAKAMPRQVSNEGGVGMAFWRRDGKELFYLGADRAIWALEVETSGAGQFSKPTVLFRPPAEIIPALGPGTTSANRDGNRFVVAVPRPQLRQITVLDRSGKAVGTVGQPGFYINPNLSPDGTRVVTMRDDPQTGNRDIWTFDLATGQGTPITNDTDPDFAPIWSPDGRHVAYVSTSEELSSIYRKAADGTGEAERLFSYTPGAGLVLTDWSADGRFLTFHDVCAGVLHVVPIGDGRSAGERTQIDWMREEYEVGLGRFSPDGRFMAYLSNEADFERAEVWVRPFDASKPEAPGPGPAVQVSTDGSIGMILWRQDGKELYFMGREREVMAVEVTTEPTFKAGTPRLLFQLPSPLPGNSTQWKNVSPDGERFTFAMPVTGQAQGR